ncbi:MAG: CotH kinase family protein [Muribaculaceae bacterium]|nr:CotH kinase family protein [Muribaculaceae bacterium]
MKHFYALLASAVILPSAAMSAEQHSGTLPVLYVNTENNEEITTKEYYLQATYYLDNNGLPDIESIGDADNPVSVEIKARGNYTWTGFDKKPYKLKFSKKTEFMGMDKNKHFALLAHADDEQGFMRNIAGFELSRRLGLPWTPAERPVEFYLNGDYKGLYFVTQTIRIDSTRVDITEQEDEAVTDVDGGWLVEIDNYDTDPHITVIEHNGYPIYFTYSSPEILSPEQEAYLTEQMNGINDAVYAEDKNTSGWLDYIDLESAARFYIVQEILDDCESYHGSCYLYKDRGESTKWHFGPVWDFGNAFRRGSKDKFVWQDPEFNQTWIGEIYKFPAFQAKVREVWAEFCKTGYDGLEQYLTDYASKISVAAGFNYERWNQYGNDDVKARTQEMIQMIRNSVDWLGDQWGAKPEISTEPGVDIYIRGDFNNWNTTHRLTCLGNGIYEYDLQDADFSGAFKIASSDWNTIDYGAAEDGMTPQAEQEFKLEKSGKNINFPQVLTHRLVVDLKNETLMFTDHSGVDAVETDSADRTEIYTVTGQRVSEMGDNGIYIVKTGTKTVKIIK